MNNPITYASYWSRCGSGLQPPFAENVSVELTRDKLNSWVNGRRPSMIYVGPVDDAFRAELLAFFNSLDPGRWEGKAKERPEQKDGNCVWNVSVRTTDWKEKLDAAGEDTAKPGARLEAEARLVALLEKNVPRLQREVPKTIQSFTFSLMKPYRHYSVSADERNGLVRVSGRAGDRQVPDFYAGAGIVAEMQKLVDLYRLEDWHGFESSPHREDDFSLSVKFSTFQQVYAHGRLAETPARYDEAAGEIVRRIGGLAERYAEQEARLPPRITKFTFSESGMRTRPEWIYYERLDEDGLHPYLRCTMGRELLGESRVTPELQAKFAQFFRDVGGWNGFRGVNRHVLDGWGFALNASYSDRREGFSASGSNKFPAGYKERSEELHRLFFQAIPREKLKPFY